MKRVDTELLPLALALRALGDPLRLRICQILPTENHTPNFEQNVNKLSEELSLPQPTTSHHLKILRQAGIIGFHKRSNCVYYYLIRERLQEVWQQLEDYLPDKSL